MKHTNPKYIGPGYWASFHRLSIVAESINDDSKLEERRKTVAQTIIRNIETFPCDDCKNHALNYLSKHPISDCINSNTKFALFNWTVRFHNEVNLRINKPTISIEEATLMWSDEGSGMCFKDCGNDDKFVTKDEVFKKYLLLLD